MKKEIYLYIVTKKDMKKFYSDVIQKNYGNIYLIFQDS